MKTYTSPKAEIKRFISENVIAASGVTTNPLIAKTSISFTNSQANVSWKDKISK